MKQDTGHAWSSGSATVPDTAAQRLVLTKEQRTGSYAISTSNTFVQQPLPPLPFAFFAPFAPLREELQINRAVGA